ncbi:acyl-CoA dehydrogenase [Terasakiispira papahanaumokuakeensis]|uniref:Acyl-coenzyme A dehydrogenase n=1 Tax=Terasakiispira papahanaumokuakeensis TaxID=197479 RepID=A0A1E2V749_9GAMM|nr:acyl-CoA dehydrogenase [Terasakiispira papahanaumokuakeensis]ODC02811.1 acyl-CoA dehydrogenase [Terasakiispira papahanaumokuakeensis]
MAEVLLLIVTLVALGWCMMRETGALFPLGVAVIATGLALAIGAGGQALLWALVAITIALCGIPTLRQRWLTPKAFAFFGQVAPRVSETEKVALEAGTIGWDGELFSGKPQWQALLDQPTPDLAEDEQAFLDHQCSVAAGMCNAWDVVHKRADLPAELWEYLKREGFFGMIIPKQYGGLGFSARAQSAVLQKLACNESLMVTVGVPNSLGPGELLLKYGTEAQKDYYLPRLADGREIPCFGLTGPRAGSDATSLPDTGIICKGDYQGEEVLGIRLNFEKRWITLAPVATVVGLAFRLFDPDQLLGDTEDLGITLALLPRETDGMEIGRRHCPTGSPFMNGPIRGQDVFIPLEWIIGGEAQIGQGWRMLIECLSVGRCITLPSGAAGMSRYAIGWSGGFTRVRRQFNVPVAEMEGVQEALARMSALGYIAQAAVMQTANMIDHGAKPAVPSAILKSQLTEMSRQLLADAMDVHGGKTVTLGPRNYLGHSWAGAPVSITVEGANIMTRNLMIYGQGAIRCHPWVLKELAAHEANDQGAFDQALFGHVGLVLGNLARSLAFNLGVTSDTANLHDEAVPYARDVNRLSAGLGLCSDAAMATLGGKLKQREMISARLGDVLSNLYLTSMLIKQWHERPAVPGEQDIFHYSCQWLLARAEMALDELLRNFPNRAVAWSLKASVLPFGRRRQLPADTLAKSIAHHVSTASPLRERLTADTWDQQTEGQQFNPLAAYNRLLADHPRAEALYRTINKAYAKGELPAEALHPESRVEAALKAELISAEDADFMRTYEADVLEMLSVDDFDFDSLKKANA